MFGSRRQAESWCCDGFRWYYDQAGRRDFAVLVERGPDNEPVFILQHRSIELGKRLEAKTEIPVTLANETRMKFCPWCGSDLQCFYSKRVDALVRPGLRIPTGSEEPAGEH